MPAGLFQFTHGDELRFEGCGEVPTGKRHCRRGDGNRISMTMTYRTYNDDTIASEPAPGSEGIEELGKFCALQGRERVVLGQQPLPSELNAFLALRCGAEGLIKMDGI
jgi:hypothetical protein